MNLITKVIILIVTLMTPVMVLYMYSYEKSAGVVEEQINIANQNRLSHFLDTIEGTMDQVSVYANIVTKDPDFAELAAGVVPDNGYDYAAIVGLIERKLGLFSLSTSWMNRISVYFPAIKLAVSSQSPVAYNEAYLAQNLNTNWSLRSISISGNAKRAFTRYFVGPSTGVADFRKSSIVVEVDLMEDNIVALLNSFKTKGNNDPFLYKSTGDYLLNSSSDEAMVQELIRSYNIGADSRNKNHDIIKLQNKQFLVYHFTSDQLGWTLVDYVPLEDILAPVTKSKHLFYVTFGLLLLVGVAAAFLMYVHVQVPVRSLTQSVLKLKKGQFSTRITGRHSNEFQLLVAQFNEMAEQIQHLVEKVYLGEIREKEAVMKQLQSQINPHFLYNSLAFIVSMAKMNRTSPIVSMAHSLADYYRYTTRSDMVETTVREEIAFVTSYIEIMNHQLEKISYEASIPDSMLELAIPRLLIQPIVENAIVHGLEPKLTGGRIRIAGEEEAELWRIVVEDDGVGIAPSEMKAITRRLAIKEAQGASYGLWNVHQRLRYHFGDDAGLSVEPSASGGVRVVLQWRKV